MVLVTSVRICAVMIELRGRGEELGFWWDEENGSAHEISIGRNEQAQPEHHSPAALRTARHALVRFDLPTPALPSSSLTRT